VFKPAEQRDYHHHDARSYQALLEVQRLKACRKPHRSGRAITKIAKGKGPGCDLERPLAGADGVRTAAADLPVCGDCVRWCLCLVVCECVATFAAVVYEYVATLAAAGACSGGLMMPCLGQ